MTDDQKAFAANEMRVAGKAAEILGNEVFKSAVADIRDTLIEGIRLTAFVDSDLREVLCHRLALLDDLIGQLRTRIDTGKLAEESLRQKTLLQKMSPRNW